MLVILVLANFVELRLVTDEETYVQTKAQKTQKFFLKMSCNFRPS